MSIKIENDFFKKLFTISKNESLKFFRGSFSIKNKNKIGFDPVTVADQRIEKKIRDYINSLFPFHGILGEEEDLKDSECDYLWVIDPIDGTRSFISGIPVWGTLVGLLHKNVSIAGMMAQPFTGELYFATKEGSFLYHENTKKIRKLSVRQNKKLKDATLFSTSPYLFTEKTAPSFLRLQQSVQLTRFGIDCYAFCMLATGFIDLVVEVELHKYDIAALIPIIKKSGGFITQWNGQPAEQGGNIIAASTYQLYQSALQKLNQ